MTNESARVLVVEDEIIVARAIASQLEQMGYSVVGTASSGQRAIAKALETLPDLILMDIVLKGAMDGIEAATQIREQLNIPVVYLTAYADEGTLQRAKITVPYGYIVKPFSERELKVTLEIVLYRHQIEEQLEEQRDQLETLLASMSDGVIATDTQGRITFINSAAERITGWNGEDALNRDIVDIFPLISEVSGEAISNPVKQVLEFQHIVHLSDYVALVNRSGQTIPISDSAAPLRGRDGTLKGAVLVFWDMSDRRNSQILEQALRKEQELSLLRSQFISSVSHEFRNPLSSIIIAIELLERMEESLSPSQRQNYLQRIKQAAVRMNTLMEDTLVLGRAQADRLDLDLQPIDLQTFCSDIIQELAIAENTCDRIQFVYNGTLDTVNLDERLLRYILINLLSNAIKYSPNGGTIRFQVTKDNEQQNVRLSIQDEGIGIPEPEQEQIFESFFRASNVRRIQGTGLGLAIVKQCVDAHGGQIHLTSAVGIGTTVTVILPFNCVSAPE